MKRQLRSYQTLILPHLGKEEEKYLPVMLHHFSTSQWIVLAHFIFDLYGFHMSDVYLCQLLGLGSVFEQRLLLRTLVPLYVSRRKDGHLRPVEPVYFVTHAMLSEGHGLRVCSPAFVLSFKSHTDNAV